MVQLWLNYEILAFIKTVLRGLLIFVYLLLPIPNIRKTQWHVGWGVGAVGVLNNNEQTQVQLIIIPSIHLALTVCIGKPFNSTSTLKLKQNLRIKQLLCGTAKLDRQMAYKEAHNERFLFCFKVSNMAGTAVITTKSCIIIFHYPESKTRRVK